MTGAVAAEEATGTIEEEEEVELGRGDRVIGSVPRVVIITLPTEMNVIDAEPRNPPQKAARPLQAEVVITMGLGITKTGREVATMARGVAADRRTTETEIGIAIIEAVIVVEAVVIVIERGIETGIEEAEAAVPVATIADPQGITCEMIADQGLIKITMLIITLR